ncbi:hypothetical protein GCM10019016_104480 [Streptomyces prasinosporus]|uniref:Uncharacterized protein n=1 Tax=Streptomyces prasinosporus TaxID=68256 RepID=A0ABP6U9G1_9ACTN
MERAIDGGVSVAGGVGEVDGDLGVLDPPGGAGVLALDADGAGALLQVAGLVHHQHGLVVGQVLQHERAQVVPDEVGVPSGAAEQVLQTVGWGVPGVLGDRPAVLARQARQ